MTTTDWQRLEGAGIALVALFLAAFSSPGWEWWLWLVVLLLPDISMLGYVAGPKPGAALYNLGHLYALPLLVVMAGVAMGSPGLIAGGALWLAHIGIDRALGLGLKGASFKDTHLGRIGAGDQ